MAQYSKEKKKLDDKKTFAETECWRGQGNMESTLKFVLHQDPSMEPAPSLFLKVLPHSALSTESPQQTKIFFTAL